MNGMARGVSIGNDHNPKTACASKSPEWGEPSLSVSFIKTTARFEERVPLIKEKPCYATCFPG
jgi:hypothetical protein